jgi:hypothetical protein
MKKKVYTEEIFFFQIWLVALVHNLLYYILWVGILQASVDILS